MELPSITSIIRECLSTLDNPETVETKRLLAMVRARYSQCGGKPNAVKPHQLSQGKADIRARFGKLTKETVKQARQFLGEEKFVPAPSAAQITTNIGIKVVESLNDLAGQCSVADLKRTRDFCQAVGGIACARQLIILLEDIRK